MGSIVKITYTNRSMNKDSPVIFVFAKNEIPNFNTFKDGVAWKIISKIGRESSCQFTYPLETEVCASWDSGNCKTKKLILHIGDRYVVKEDETGIIITQDGSASNTNSIDVLNTLHVPNGISVELYKEGRMIICKNVVAHDQKATFILHPYLYWGMASEIQEGDSLGSAIINSESFFKLDLEGSSKIDIGLYGNAEDGYRFKIEKQY